MNVQELKNLKKGYDTQVKGEFEIITPEIAKNYLNINLNNATVRNRTANLKNINKLVKDILNDSWKPEVDSIKFNLDGVMVDGQHTCHAVIKANKPILRYVLRGVSNDAFPSLNCGKPRTHKDVLTTINLPNGAGLINKPTVVSTAINAINNIQKRHRHIDRNRSYTHSEVYDIFMKNWKFYLDPLPKIEKWYNNIGKRINQGWLAAFYYIHKDNLKNNEIDNFLNILCNGESNYPLIKATREMLAENKNLSKDHKNKLDSLDIIDRLNLLFKYYRENKLATLRNFKKDDLKSLQ